MQEETTLLAAEACHGGIPPEVKATQGVDYLRCCSNYSLPVLFHCRSACRVSPSSPVLYNRHRFPPNNLRVCSVFLLWKQVFWILGLVLEECLSRGTSTLKKTLEILDVWALVSSPRLCFKGITIKKCGHCSLRLICSISYTPPRVNGASMERTLTAAREQRTQRGVKQAVWSAQDIYTGSTDSLLSNRRSRLHSEGHYTHFSYKKIKCTHTQCTLQKTYMHWKSGDNPRFPWPTVNKILAIVFTAESALYVAQGGNLRHFDQIHMP